MLAPDGRVVLHVGEFGADLNGVAALHDAAGEQGIDGQILSDSLDVDFFAFVVEDRVAGFYFQIRNMSEAVD